MKMKTLQPLGTRLKADDLASKLNDKEEIDWQDVTELSPSFLDAFYMRIKKDGISVVNVGVEGEMSSLIESFSKNIPADANRELRRKLDEDDIKEAGVKING